MRQALKIAVLYSLFAGISIAVNILMQMVSLAVYDRAFAIALSIVVGTGAGLVTKYLLDKRWIFRYQAQGSLREARTFVLYCVMGLVTTVVFWGSEALAHWIWRTDFMRYAGGVFGLVIGYVVKYRLDKRYVFR